MSNGFPYVPFAAMFDTPYECIVAAEFERGLNRTISDVKEFLETYPNAKELLASFDEEKYADAANILNIYKYILRHFPIFSYADMSTFTFECFMMFGAKRLFYPNDKKLQRYVNYCRVTGIDIIHFKHKPGRFTSASLLIGDE